MSENAPYSGQDMIGDDTPLEEIKAYEDGRQFRSSLLSLSSDGARLEAIKELGFCLSCGEDIERRDGPCMCGADN